MVRYTGKLGMVAVGLTIIATNVFGLGEVAEHEKLQIRITNV
jgi:hypothetical protein